MKDCNTYCFSTTNRFSFGNGQKSVVVFANPQDSNCLIHIVQVQHANLSCSPVVLDSYNCAKVTGELSFTDVPIVENVNQLNCTGYRAKIAYGAGDVASSTRHLFVHSIPPYSTCTEPFPCELTLPPGTNRVYLFDTIESRCLATLCTSFVWTEKRLSH